MEHISIRPTAWFQYLVVDRFELNTVLHVQVSGVNTAVSCFPAVLKIAEKPR